MPSNDVEIQRLMDEYRRRELRREVLAAIAEQDSSRTEEERRIRAWVDGVDYDADFRARTLAQVSTDLAILGVAHPRLAFKRAVDELHACNDRQERIFAEHLKLVIVYSAALDVRARRGAGRWESDREDLLEAQLWTGIDEAKTRARIAELERRDRAAAKAIA